MADYYEKNKSNYFKVKNIKKLKELLEKCDDCTVYITNDPNEGRIAELAEDGLFKIESRKVICIFGYNITTFYDEEADEEQVISKEIQKLLCDNEICVIHGIGWENFRYLTAGTLIITNKEISYTDHFYNIQKRIIKKIKHLHNTQFEG